MEEEFKYKHERIQFGYNAFLETNWNKSAWRDDMLKIIIGKESVIIPRQDIESLMLYLSKDPSRFAHSRSKQVGVKYTPVPDSMYQKYIERKKWIEKQKPKSKYI